jgi:hypothetical protein
MSERTNPAMDAAVNWLQYAWNPPGSRQVDPATFKGEWNGLIYKGTFKLIGGFRTYSITSTPKKGWVIGPIVEPEPTN